MSSASFYKWRCKYGGMDVLMVLEMKAIAEENKRLKRMCAENQMQNAYIERYNRTVRHEWLEMHEFNTIAHAQSAAVLLQ